MAYGLRPSSGLDPQKGNSWGLLGWHKQDCTGSCCHRSEALVAIWLPRNQIINSSRAGNTSFIFSLYPYGMGGKKSKHFGLAAAQPEAEGCYLSHPQAASSFLITRGRHSGIAFKKCIPPSYLRRYVDISFSPTPEGETHVH